MSKNTRPQNTPITGGRGPRGRFRKGVSGNPGGRPQSMAAAILDRCPTVSADVVEFWVLVAFGSPAAVKKRFGVTPRMQDRLAAAAELADRLHGKPIQAIDIDGDLPNVPVFIMPSDTKIAIK